MNQPPDCPSCGAQPQLRRPCQRCGEASWVITHLARPGEAESHYKWGHEVVPCQCSEEGSKQCSRLWEEKQMRRKARDTGIPFKPPNPRAPVCTPEMARKAAEGLARGLKPAQALRAAGFSETTVKRGPKGINHMIRAELKTLGRKYIELGRDLSPQDQEDLVRGRLAHNAIIGTDKGAVSAKQLGADKRIAMWQPDSQVGVVVLQAPQMRQINHEVPILPPILEEEENV